MDVMLCGDPVGGLFTLNLKSRDMTKAEADLEELNRRVAARMGTSVRRYSSDTSLVSDMLQWIGGRAKVPGIIRMKTEKGEGWRWSGNAKDDGPCIICCKAVLSVVE